MNADDFSNFSDKKQRELIVRALLDETDVHVIFGDTPDKTYKNLAKRLHPDAGGLDTDFQVLNQLWQDAEAQISTGLYGTGSKASSVDVNGTLFPLKRLLSYGEIADVWLSEDDKGRACVVKTCRDFGDSYMMKREQETLVWMRAKGMADQNTVPNIIASDATTTVWDYDYEVLSEPQDLVSLYDLASSYDNLLPDKAIGWIWRRVLGSLVRPGYFGAVHGAVTPDNILIDVNYHRGVLVGWGHSTLNQGLIEDIPADWEDMYPASVLNKERPTPRVDIHVAAESMLWASKALPGPMQAYFRGMTGKYGETPYNIQRLLEMWDMVMYQHLGWKKEFIPLAYTPTAIQWEWFQ